MRLRPLRAAVPALLEGAVDVLAAAAAGPVPVRRVAQLVQQCQRLGMPASSMTHTSGSAWSGGISPAMLPA